MTDTMDPTEIQELIPSILQKQAAQTRRPGNLLPVYQPKKIAQALDAGNKDHYRLVEIFDSVQGEGVNAGVPMTFVRFAKCNLACDFCDTPYDRVSVDISEDALASIIAERDPMWVMFTGGEPMLQLTSSLLHKIMAKVPGAKFGCESNGMVWNPVYSILDHVTISPKMYFDTRDNPIPPEKVMAEQLVEKILDGSVRFDEVRYLITGPKDTIFGLPEDVHRYALCWVVSPLFHDPALPATFVSGQGHPSPNGKVDEAAFRRCMYLMKHLRRHPDFEWPMQGQTTSRGLRLSVQTHKLIGVR